MFLLDFFAEYFDTLTVKDNPSNKNLVNNFQGLYHVRRNILSHSLCEFVGRLYGSTPQQT